MTVEFFLVIPMVILVLVASLQVVGIARARMELQAAVREGVRVAATTPDPSRAVAAVSGALPPGMRDHTRISVERPSRAGAEARVTAIFKHLLGAPFPSDVGVELRVTASMRTER